MRTAERSEHDRQAFQQLADELYREMEHWREQHPNASLDEIVAQAIPRRRKLMGLWLQQLACQAGTGEVPEGLPCEKCGRPLVYKGRPKREVEHLEAEVELKRAYYHCPHCKDGVFPPRPPTANQQAFLVARHNATSSTVGDGNPVI